MISYTQPRDEVRFLRSLNAFQDRAQNMEVYEITTLIFDYCLEIVVYCIVTFTVVYYVLKVKDYNERNKKQI